MSIPLCNQDNSKQEAPAPAGEYKKDAKKLPQIIDLEFKLNKQKHYTTTLTITHKPKNAQKNSYVKNNTTSK